MLVVIRHGDGDRPRAARLAAHLEHALDIAVRLEAGDRGQLEVRVGDEVVARRASAPWKQRLEGGWPDPEEVVAAVRKRLSMAGG